MMKLDEKLKRHRARLQWLNARRIEGKLPRGAMLARLRFCGQHPHMEEDHVLAFVSKDGATCWPVMLADVA
jgi:hypothetical protein